MARRPEPPGPKPPLPGLLKMVILWTGPGTPTPNAANVLHARWSDNAPHPQADVQHVATAFEGAWISNIIPVVSSSWRYLSTTVTSLGGDGLQAVATTATNGATVSTAQPPQVAVVGSWRANITWRGGRPRTYLPGVPASNVTTAGGAQLSTSAINAFSVAFGALLTATNAITAGGATTVFGFPSYYTNYTLRPVPVFFPFSSVRVHGRLDSQRRRNGKEIFFP